MPVAAAAAVTAGSSIAKGVSSMNASSQAANAGINANDQANKISQNVWDQNQANLNPYIQNGQQGQNVLAGLLGTGGNANQSQAAFQTFLNSTPYQFQLNQGLKAAGYGNANQLGSGAFSKAMNNYAQGQAGGAINNYMGMLQNLGSMGLNATSQFGTFGNAYAGQQYNGLNNIANAKGMNAMGQANGINSMLSGLDSSFGMGSLTNGGGTAPMPSTPMFGPGSSSPSFMSSMPDMTGGTHSYAGVTLPGVQGL